jgi:hypothetical protein
MAVLTLAVIRSFAGVLSKVQAAPRGNSWSNAPFPPECFSPKTQTNLANSTGYFEEHHYAGDYWPMVLISEANALSSWESIIRQESRRSANG